MNQFTDLVTALKKRAQGQELLDKVLPELDRLNTADEKEPGFHLPYSSDPVPIDNSWVTREMARLC